MPLTHEQVALAMAPVFPFWNKTQWETFFSLSQEEQQAMAQLAQDSSDPPGKSTWETITAVLTVLATIAGSVTGLATAVSAIGAVIGLLKK